MRFWSTSWALLMLAWACQPPPSKPPPAPVAAVESTPPAAASDSVAASDPATPPAPGSAAERADVASPRQVEHSWMSLAEWRSRFQAQLTDPERGQAEVVFLGDSITQEWKSSEAWNRYFARYRPLNLGIGGDQTQHVLWRLQHGALDGLKARVVVILIGINNLGNGFTPEQTFQGVRAVLNSVQKRLPGVHVVLLGILPAAERPDDASRGAIAATNQKLATLNEPGHVAVADIGSIMLEKDGSISPSVMRDFLHPTPAGYDRLSAAVAPLVERALVW